MEPLDPEAVVSDNNGQMADATLAAEDQHILYPVNIKAHDAEKTNVQKEEEMELIVDSRAEYMGSTAVQEGFSAHTCTRTCKNGVQTAHCESSAKHLPRILPCSLPLASIWPVQYPDLISGYMSGVHYVKDVTVG